MKTKAALACVIVPIPALTVDLAVAQSPEASSGGVAAPDNTKSNKLDSNRSPSADDQKNTASDLKITQQIRQSVMSDKTLSSYAHNAKIVAVNGTVTLNGVVQTEAERNSIAQKAEQVVGSDAFRAAGADAQRRSIVLLKNGATPDGALLPVRGTPKLYVEHIAPEIAAGYGQVVQNAEEADLAILRIEAPYEQRDGNFLERLFHAGDLAFKPDELRRILDLVAKVPTIVDIYLDRPAVIPEIAAQSAALLANFGASDTALLDVVFGRCAPSGKLPFELPSSVEAVQRQKSDLPYDSENPLFTFGHGLTY